MNVADDDDLSDHDGGAGGSHFTSPNDRIGLGFGVSLGSPPPGGGESYGFGNTSVEAQSPFDDLNDLMVHHAHLAVFLNYVISSGNDNADPAALVSKFHLLFKIKTFSKPNSCIFRHESNNTIHFYLYLFFNKR